MTVRRTFEASGILTKETRRRAGEMAAMDSGIVDIMKIMVWRSETEWPFVPSEKN